MTYLFKVEFGNKTSFVQGVNIEDLRTEIAKEFNIASDAFIVKVKTRSEMIFLPPDWVNYLISYENSKKHTLLVEEVVTVKGSRFKKICLALVIGLLLVLAALAYVTLFEFESDAQETD